MQYRTLLIGVHPKKIQKLVQGMRRVGVPAQVAGSVSGILHDYSAHGVDAIVIGPYLNAQTREEIVQQWRMLRPDAAIVHIKALVVGELVGEMVKAAVFKTSNHEAVVGALSASKRHVSFSTLDTSNVAVTLYHLAPLFRVRIRQLHRDENALSGQQIVQISRRDLGLGGKRFIVITINNTEKHIVFL